MKGSQSTLGGVWRTRDGTLVPLEDMSDAHLVNSLAMCLRMGRTREIRFLGKEIERRAMADVLDDCVVGGCDRYGSLSN